ncbi:MAG TPA: hypothetical protein VLW45_09100 [Pelomicrobium sp.]|nr:hypothetical protein [Pelomicrobium sp.]
MIFCIRATRNLARIAAVAVGALALAAPAAAGERFIVPRPDGWKMVLQAREKGLTRTQLVPNSQTLEEWTDMVTSQTLPRFVGISVEEYLARITQAAKQVCTELVHTPIVSAETNGYPAASMGQFCTRYAQTGLGEVTVFKVIQGREMLYVVHRSWRMPPFQAGTQPVPRADFDAWVKYLDTVIVCDPADSARPCPN